MFVANTLRLTYSYFKKGCHGQYSILEPKGALGIVIMNDIASVKVVTVWPLHYDEPVLCSPVYTTQTNPGSTRDSFCRVNTANWGSTRFSLE